MTWGFIWLMFIMKIPIFMLFGVVWWAVRKSEDPVEPGEDVRVRPSPHPPSRARRPRRPRSPHGDPMPLPPPRVRRVVAIGREPARR